MSVSTRVRSTLIAGVCLMRAARPAAARQGRQDVAWPNRATFGIDGPAWARYRQRGRERFLDEQLHPGTAALPAGVQDRDSPVPNNYRDVLGGVFSKLWGRSRARIGTVFPGAVPRDLGLV